ncbi:MAG: hypothetical protein ACXW0S_10310 [Solirubrobacterales bacterium]
MEGALPIIFLAVVLKIPVFFGIWLIWHAVRDEPTPEDMPGAEEEHGFRRWRREPKRPRGPRRGGPHGGAAAPGYTAARRSRAAAPAAAVSASASAGGERTRAASR